MNNTEAKEAFITKNSELSTALQTLGNATQYLVEYEREMDNWKAEVITAKIAEIKTEATAAGVDLSTWDGSSAD